MKAQDVSKSKHIKEEHEVCKVLISWPGLIFKTLFKIVDTLVILKEH